jgi:uncharacterized protein with HEPN domain
MRSKREDIVRLKHIAKAIELIEKFCYGIDIEAFGKDEMIQSAVIRQLEIIGEATANISDDLRSQYDEIPWRNIKGFRNVMVHEYFRMDIPLVWEAIRFDLPDLKINVSMMISSLEKN